MSSDYGIAIDGKGEWNFGNESARTVVISGIDNSSSSHTDNCKDDILMLVEGDSFSINGNFGAPKKSLILISVKQK